MVSSDSTGDSAVRTASQFATTHWSVVLEAADSASPNGHEALEALCRTYWYPLYAFVRLKGYGPEDAKDLTQAFFEQFLRKESIKHVARERGRFRNFLLTVLQRFLRDQSDRAAAVKRGGGVPLIPLDVAEAEAQYHQAAIADRSPELAFDRAWAETVLHNSVERLRVQCEAEGRGPLFGVLKLYLTRLVDPSGYGATAQVLGMDTSAVAMAVMRLRRQYRKIVQDEVANTVATPAEVEDEIRYLVELLSAE